ncbi:MAG: hypothetical protein HC893_13340, partial [Chloroflexaceae bacterium]|nr:hypothetical protein [Chloroflexaceae bacterium]
MKSTPHPAPATTEQAESTTTRIARKTWSYILALAAGLCWAGALLLLFLADMHVEANPLAPQRVLFYVLVLAAGAMTFIPAAQWTGYEGLALEGIGGMALLLYTLAFVPPPTDWLLALPDLPVYLLFIMALFWSVSALVFPLCMRLGIWCSNS